MRHTSRKNTVNFAQERQAAILELLTHESAVHVAELARTFKVSAVTIRSDLDALAQAGKLQRTHGGAISLQRTLTVSVQDKRINVNAPAKQAIAQVARTLVKAHDTLLVDSGTTALAFVRALEGIADLTIITPDLTIADFIDESMPQVNAIVLGGCVRKSHRYVYGPLAHASLALLHVDLAVVCPGSFVPVRGFMTDFPPMAEVKTAMLQAAKRRVALLDASKVAAQGMIRFAELSEFDDIVMDRDPAGVLAAMIDELPSEQRPRLHTAE
ncbi:DeoR/GlpR family DNA-binding transcription regulator [Collinsella sp. zg1085]|uniref:DeoR/GlpR family DNA-binding transcription regulator n=1 Tax=Collinsella sp. zg1085 TaxID=2844380 RepID=UPI001C0D852B|nr:DeoR/GlpR family DNA-binding transcription regulator [Collinsella sp. zg1085]QWT17843.1 DeoR/GlpR family DNA-binding transcription regulator [Collinsella sp. zg1085]